MLTLAEKQGQLTVVRCWCGIQHAVPESLRDLQLRQFNDGLTAKFIYCPLGHRYQPAGITEAERLRRRLVEREAAHDQTRAALRNTENQRRAERAAKTRLKNRIGNGVCPCCKRSFTNLRRHMDTKHPDYTKAKEK